jgi:hypothetical protein
MEESVMASTRYARFWLPAIPALLLCLFAWSHPGAVHADGTRDQDTARFDLRTGDPVADRPETTAFGTPDALGWLLDELSAITSATDLQMVIHLVRQSSHVFFCATDVVTVLAAPESAIVTGADLIQQCGSVARPLVAVLEQYVPALREFVTTIGDWVGWLSDWLAVQLPTIDPGRVRDLIGTGNSAVWCAINLTDLFKRGTKFAARMSDLQDMSKNCGDAFGALWLLIGPKFGPSTSLAVSADQTKYRVDDNIWFCYQVPAKGHVVLRDRTTAHGGVDDKKLDEFDDDGTGDCLHYIATEPTGKECFRLYYSATTNGKSTYKEKCWDVVAKPRGA